VAWARSRIPSWMTWPNARSQPCTGATVAPLPAVGSCGGRELRRPNLPAPGPRRDAWGAPSRRAFAAVLRGGCATVAHCHPAGRQCIGPAIASSMARRVASYASQMSPNAWSLRLSTWPRATPGFTASHHIPWRPTGRRGAFWPRPCGGARGPENGPNSLVGPLPPLYAGGAQQLRFPREPRRLAERAPRPRTCASSSRPGWRATLERPVVSRFSTVRCKPGGRPPFEGSRIHSSLTCCALSTVRRRKASSASVRLDRSNSGALGSPCTFTAASLG
jgi:hypothetical protein